MEYMTVKEASEKWKISERRITALCVDDRIEGAKKFGLNWAIPSNTQKPQDQRKKENIPYQKIDNSNLKIERVWSMPNKNTFDIKPIRDLILEEINDGIWIDPFANKNKIATVTNDLNPEYDTNYHLDALDFLKMFDDNSVDGVLYDPPYSPRQVSESYNNFGINVTWDTTKASFWSKHKAEISRILKQNGKVITFGWNSGGIGHAYGFDKTRILLVPHGGWHNDTICTVEIKREKEKHTQMKKNDNDVNLATSNKAISEIDKRIIDKLTKLPYDFWNFKDDDTRELTHGLHTYPAMMIYPISRNLIKIVKSEREIKSIFDPFSGSGTVLIEGILSQINEVYGNDLNPLALFLTKVKTTPIEQEQLISAINFFSSRLSNHYKKLMFHVANINEHLANKFDLDYSEKKGWGDSAPTYLKDYIKEFNLEDVVMPEFNNIGYWFKPHVILELQIIKDTIDFIENEDIKNFFLLAFSETIRLVSNRRNGEFKMFRMPPEKVKIFSPNVRDEFTKILDRNVNKMLQFSELYSTFDIKSKVQITADNSMLLSSMKDNCADLIITSPPYGDSRTTVAYGEFSRLSLQWIDMSESNTEVTKIDKSLMGGNKYRNGFEFNLPSETLRNSLSHIMEKDIERAGDVFSFYEDLYKSMCAISNKTNHSGYQFWVVGNRTVKSHLLQTDKIMVEFGNALNLVHMMTMDRVISNKVMPSKNSPTNEAGKTLGTMSNEHIIMFKKL
jgi:tRNA G10  N-methylase Trm11